MFLRLGPAHRSVLPTPKPTQYFTPLESYSRLEVGLDIGPHGLDSITVVCLQQFGGLDFR